MKAKPLLFSLVLIGVFHFSNAQKVQPPAVTGQNTSSLANDTKKKNNETIDSCCLVKNKGTEVLTVCFDFATKKYLNGDEAKLQTLKLGQLYRIKIININTNLYKISVGKRDTVITTAITPPSFTGLGIPDLSGLIIGLTTITTGGAPVSSKQVDLSDKTVQNKMMDISNSIQPFDKGVRKYAADAAKKVPTDIEIVKASQIVYATKLQGYVILIAALRTKIDKLFNSYNRYLVQGQLVFPTTENNSFFNLGAMNLNDLYVQLNGIRTDINDLSDALEIANSKYTLETEKYAKLIQGTDDLKKNDDKLKSTYQQLNTTSGKARDALSADNVLKYISSLTAIFNNIKREYTSFPMQFSKDQNTLVLSVQPRKDELGLEPYSTTYTFPLRQKDFWAVSTGVYISSLYDKSYSTLKTTTAAGDTTFTIKSENPKKFEFGINAMIRYGWKIGDEKNNNFWQVGCGPGITISDNVRGRLMLGTGFAHGKRHKLVLDIGGIAGYTNQLSVLYKDNGVYSVNPGAGTVSKLNFGIYSSVSYLFF